MLLKRLCQKNNAYKDKGAKKYVVFTHSGTTVHTPSTPQSGTLRTHPSA